MQWLLGVFRELKWPGRGIDHPPPYSTEVKEEVELDLWAFVAWFGLKFTFYVIAVRSS